MRGILFGCLAAACLMVPQAHAAKNLLFIVDGSNSMWGQVDGVAKIATAKTALARLVSDLPDDINVGLMAYGHQNEGDCKDVDFLAPFVPAANRSFVVDAVNTITPKGKTPIAYALQAAGHVLGSDYEQDQNSVVLISDGIESCGGDPCAVASSLSGGNVDLKVHVVGFDIADEDQAKISCIAENGGGQYFSASSTEGFTEAVSEAVKVAQAAEAPPAPEPAKAEWTEIFRDDFDGTELAEHWEVLNPDPDSFIVEDGKLLVLASKKGVLNDPTAANIFRLKQEVPKGDWRMTVRVTMAVQTLREFLSIGRYDSATNYLIGYQSINGGTYGDFYVGVQKLSGDTNKFFAAPLIDDQLMREMPSLTDRPIDVQFEKEGRNYRSRVRWADDPDAQWVQTEDLTVLRPKGDFVLHFAQKTNSNGETPGFVDWVKIEAKD